jgi:hypothetical protein
MKSIKVSELTGAALDWAVAMANDYKPRIYSTQSIRAQLPSGGVIAPFMPSFNWAQGGPIIEREGIATRENGDSDDWYACKRWDNHGKFGATPLIAAMRCYVASKLGDEVEVPEELL